MNYISNLPRELIHSNLLKGVDARDVSNLCQTLPQLKQDCQSDEFWKKMVELYYPFYMTDKTPTMTWKYYFQGITSTRLVRKNMHVRQEENLLYHDYRILTDRSVSLPENIKIWKFEFNRRSLHPKEISLSYWGAVTSKHKFIIIHPDKPDEYEIMSLTDGLPIEKVSYDDLLQMQLLDKLYQKWLSSITASLIVVI